MDLPCSLPPLVIMGVSGTGKTAVGARVAADLGVTFIDGDDLHPSANKAKMHAGIPLDDADRIPWLESIATELSRVPAPLIACSALKRTYRDLLRTRAPRTFFIHLDGPRKVIAEHLARRSHEFMSPLLLDSQLATLEPLGEDEAHIVVSIEQPLSAVRRAVIASLRTALAARPAGTRPPEDRRDGSRRLEGEDA